MYLHKKEIFKYFIFRENIFKNVQHLTFASAATLVASKLLIHVFEKQKAEAIKQYKKQKSGWRQLWWDKEPNHESCHHYRSSSALHK